MHTTSQETAPMTQAQERFAEKVLTALFHDCNNRENYELVAPDRTGIKFEIEGADRDYAYDSRAVIAKVKAHTEIQHYSLQCVPGGDNGYNYESVYILPAQNAVMLLEGSPGDFTDDNYDLYLSGSILFFDSIEDARQFAKQHATKVVLEVAKIMTATIQKELAAIPAGDRDLAGKDIRDLLELLPDAIAKIVCEPANAQKVAA